MILQWHPYDAKDWKGSSSASILARVESNVVRLINNKDLTDSLDALHFRHKVASLYLFYRYYFGHCSSELHDRVPQPLPRPRCTRQAVTSHSYSVELCNTRIERYSNCFFPSTSRLWNSLPAEVFPDSYNLSSFKRQVYHHLKTV